MLTLAAQLRMHVPGLPTQAPELNAMSQLWRSLKHLVAANRQASSIDALAAEAAPWTLELNPREARQTAGMRPKHLGLTSLMQNF